MFLNHDADGFRQENYLSHLNLEYSNLELADGVESAQVAMAISYEDWQKIKLAKSTPPNPNRLTKFLSLIRTQNQTSKSEERAGVKYCNKGEPRKQ